MSTRRHGKDQKEDQAWSEGLLRRLRAPKGREGEIAFTFGLMRAIRMIAPLLSQRDDELIEVVLLWRNLTRAAEAKAPDNPEALRCYLSERYREFKNFSKIFFKETSKNAHSRPSAKDLRTANLHPKTRIRGLKGHLEPESPLILAKSTYISPMVPGA